MHRFRSAIRYFFFAAFFAAFFAVFLAGLAGAAFFLASPRGVSMAAWAAEKRAIGTRNGEQET